MKTIEMRIEEAIMSGIEFEFLNDTKKYLFSQDLRMSEIDSLLDFYNAQYTNIGDSHIAKYNTLSLYHDSCQKLYKKMAKDEQAKDSEED